MKLKDLITITENKKNKQVNASIKKRKLKDLDKEIKDLLNIKIKW